MVTIRSPTRVRIAPHRTSLRRSSAGTGAAGVGRLVGAERNGRTDAEGPAVRKPPAPLHLVGKRLARRAACRPPGWLAYSASASLPRSRRTSDRPRTAAAPRRARLGPAPDP